MSETEQNPVAPELDAESPVPQPELSTQRLVLRPFRENDAEIVQELLQCREIAANTRTIEHPYPEGAAKIWIGTHEENWNKGGAAIFAICRNSDLDSPVGAIGLEINSRDENAELGYWIGEPFWGEGFCTEAAREIVSFGFSHFGLKKIHAHHLARNPASGRIMEKIGMEKEGYLRSHIKKWGVFEDIVFYGIVSDNWPPETIM